MSERENGPGPPNPKRIFSRRALLQAGWTVPVIMAVTPTGAFGQRGGDPPSAHLDQEPGGGRQPVPHEDAGHSDYVGPNGHGDQVFGHFDFGHTDRSPHLDSFTHGDHDHGDSGGHYDHVKHTDYDHTDYAHADSPGGAGGHVDELSSAGHTDGGHGDSSHADKSWHNDGMKHIDHNGHGDGPSHYDSNHFDTTPPHIDTTTFPHWDQGPHWDL